MNPSRAYMLVQVLNILPVPYSSSPKVWSFKSGVELVQLVVGRSKARMPT